MKTTSAGSELSSAFPVTLGGFTLIKTKHPVVALSPMDEKKRCEFASGRVNKILITDSVGIRRE